MGFPRGVPGGFWGEFAALWGLPFYLPPPPPKNGPSQTPPPPQAPPPRRGHAPSVLGRFNVKQETEPKKGGAGLGQGKGAGSEERGGARGGRGQVRKGAGLGEEKGGVRRKGAGPGVGGGASGGGAAREERGEGGGAAPQRPPAAGRTHGGPSEGWGRGGGVCDPPDPDFGGSRSRFGGPGPAGPLPRTYRPRERLLRVPGAAPPAWGRGRSDPAVTPE